MISLASLFAASPQEGETPTYWLSDKDVVNGFPVKESQAVFSKAFQDLQDKYIEDVEIGKLVLSGLKGLGSYVPGLGFSIDADRFLVYQNGNFIINVTPPYKTDSEGWAWLTIFVITKLREISPELQQAYPEQLYYLILNTMLRQLDNQSKYVHAEQANRISNKEGLSASIGIGYRHVGNGIQVIRLFPDSPAEMAGLDVGDLITHVNGFSLNNASYEYIESLLYGKPNTVVKIDAIDYVTHQLDSFYLRRVLMAPSNVSMVVHDTFATLVIQSFNQDVRSLTLEAIDQAKQKLGNNFKGLVLDLRGNPGGNFDRMVSLLNIFVHNKPLFKTQGRADESTKEYQAKKGDILQGRPLVVLMDQTSGSLSEIFAASLQDVGRAVIIGTPSAGKGKVPTTIDLSNGDQMNFSWAKVLTPSGLSIDGIGVLPVVCLSTFQSQSDIQSFIDDVKADRFFTDLKAWRMIPEFNSEEREKIRKGCPAIEPSDETNHFGVEVAKAILQNPAVYRKLIEMSQIQ